MTSLDIIKSFNHCFTASYNVVLKAGADEPVYIPAQGYHPAEIHFREDFLSSALHEISHWCLAGSARRTQEDYGYWYESDSRNLQQQRMFESVEVKPQAIEKMLHHVLGLSFRVSADNLAIQDYDTSAFENAVHHQFACYITQTFPERAEQFAQQLLSEQNINVSLYEFLK